MAKWPHFTSYNSKDFVDLNSEIIEDFSFGFELFFFRLNIFMYLLRSHYPDQKKRKKKKDLTTLSKGAHPMYPS